MIQVFRILLSKHILCFLFLILPLGNCLAQAPIFEEDGLAFTTSNSIIFKLLCSPRSYYEMKNSLNEEGVLFLAQPGQFNDFTIIVGEIKDDSKYCHVHALGGDSDANVTVPWTGEWWYKDNYLRQIECYFYSSDKEDLKLLRDSFISDFTNYFSEIFSSVKKARRNMWKAHGEDVSCIVCGPLGPSKEIPGGFMIELKLIFN